MEPTPTALMQYLCRLVTPPGGTVLDMFAGSGSTGKAAIPGGFRFIGIEIERERYLLRRCGYGLGNGTVLLTPLAGRGPANADAYDWTNGRTMQVAHLHIEQNWGLLNSGDVICVETLLGERDAPKVSEQFAPIGT